jgi:peptidoglycan/LPS O-acetylase OafA/YrhL
VRYRRDIDGLRAIAVLSVLFYHAEIGLHGGYVGVDIFFVISGFLITRVLIKSVDEGRFSYTQFWLRRIRRLLPALAVLTLVTAVASYLLLLPEDLNDFGGALICQPLMAVNIYYWRVIKDGYFGDPPEIRPLLHTWSLGLEEQFYLILPILISSIVSRPGFRPHLPKILAILATFSFFLSVMLTPQRSVLAFFTLPTRAWELLMGSLAAMVPDDSLSQRTRTGMGWVGLALVAYSVTKLREDTIFPGWVAVVPCLGAMLLLLAGEKSPVNRGLSSPPLVLTGLISYSLYLWHWPIMAFGRYTGLVSATSAKVLVLILSFALGYLSWRYIETPFRKSSARWVLLGLASAYAVGCLVVGSTIRAEAGFPKNWQVLRKDNHVWELNLERLDTRSPVLGDQTQSRAAFLLWGDSHAMSLAPIMDTLGKEYHLKGIQITKSSTAPLVHWGFSTKRSDLTPEAQRTWSQVALDAVRENKVRAVFLVGFWAQYDRESLGQEILETQIAFEKEGARVYFVADVPHLAGDPVRRLALAQRWKILAPPSVSPSDHEHKNRRVSQAVKESGISSILDPAPLIFDWESLVSKEGRALYHDDDHLTEAGAHQLRSLFEPLFQEWSRQPDPQVYLNSRVSSPLSVRLYPTFETFSKAGPKA